ncbi:MAG: AmmeMemoRadiSam system radical SAM enzyme [Chloroflexi bacterium]|nr:AmmeMemoRadiSam system radical SAM enzyme [Chloroflexota bacterium]
MVDFEVKNLIKNEDSGIRHLACRRYCLIKKEQHGSCFMYKNSEGKLYSLGYGCVSSYSIDPIEKKPLFHFHPFSKVFSVGGYSCNFACPSCQNYTIARFDQQKLNFTRRFLPQDLVDKAIKTGCHGLAFTYNEPTVYAEYTLDTFQLAKRAGLYTVYVTNGYMSCELIEQLAPVLDAASVDIKAFSKKTMHKVTAAINDFQGILHSCLLLKESGVHVEIVTNLIPTVNTDMHELKDAAKWVCDNLGDKTPFHITRYIPQQSLPGIPPTDYDFFNKVLAQNWALGLKYSYVGNVPNHSAQNTYCAECGEQLVGRFGSTYLQKGLNADGTCHNCHAAANFII